MSRKKRQAVKAQKLAERQAKQKKGFRQTKRTTDKWKKKTWFMVYAPKEFENTEIAETVGEKPENLMGRVFIVSVRDLANQMKKGHIYMRFKVNDIKGNKAYTESVGHYIRESYLKRMTRRRSSKAEIVQDEQINGGKVRVKTVVLCARKVSGDKRADLNRIVSGMIAGACKGQEYAKLIDEFVFGTIPSKIFNEAKKVAPIKRIEIIKSQFFKS